MIIRSITDFKYGIIDTLEDFNIPDGAASDSLNWLTEGDHIEIRRGYKVLGTYQTGAGKITGIWAGAKRGGGWVMFGKRGQSLMYYNPTTEDWDEVGTNLFGSDAEDDDALFSPYSTNAGDQVWVTSPNATDVYKIMLASPTSAVAQYDSSKNFKGWIKIKRNRMFLWGRIKDRTGQYGSWIDAQNYTDVSSEVLGSSGSLTYEGTLAFKAGESKRTCFGIVITDGVEIFTDDYNGILTGDQGGTGTINYATGAYSVTFNAVAAGSVTSDYSWEDATNEGIADFTKSASRLAGEGFIFRQDDGGGNIQNVFSYNNIEYCMHKLKTWELNIGADDTAATNLIFRERVGIPSLRGGVETGDGIYYIDDTDETDPQIRILTLRFGTELVQPFSISRRLKIKKNLHGIKLSDYLFDKTAGIEFGKYIIFACRTKTSDNNNIVLIYNKDIRSIDKADYYASCFAIWNGSLVAGDSATDNFQQLFSGYDDDDSLIGNRWVHKADDLGFKGRNKVKRIILTGLIDPDQNLEVWAAQDHGDFVEIKENDEDIAFVEGNGAYVDGGNKISIGAPVVGRLEVGGGTTDYAYRYYREVYFRQDKFYNTKLKFIATGIGYVSVSAVDYRDIRRKDTKIPKKYRT